jgi:hypothetical protein
MRTLLLLLLFLLLLPGCVSSKTFVLQPIPTGTHLGRIALKPADSTAHIDPRSQSDFQARLAAQLKNVVGADVADPPDLIVQYRFVLFDKGSGPARVVSGLTNIAGSPIYGLGDGDVGIEVLYLKPDGTLIGHIVTDGPISGALGSTSAALDSAAASVAKYTKANFTCPLCGRVGPPNPTPEPIAGLKRLADTNTM